MNAIRTLSVRLAMLGGALVLTTAGIVSSVAIVGAGPAVAAGTITQIAPDKGSVSYGTPFRDQLQTSGNIGPVTFATDSATTWGTVSSTGAVSASGKTPRGTYLLFGTDADAFGDSGQWRYTLTAETVFRQTVPTSGLVTVAGSAAFTDHLRTTGNIGPVTFIKTGGGAGIKVSSGGKITTTGTLPMGTYAATGTMSDAFGDTGSFTYVLTVKAVTITQTAPTSGTVPTIGSAAFTDHLRTTGNIGPVTFIKTGGGAGIKVSSGGKITTTGTLPMGTYAATGTMSDAFGDTGTFTYTLTIAGPPITQIVPTSGSTTTIGSAAFTDHLRTTGNIGPVTFTKTGGTAGLKVSSGGKITTTGTLAVGYYTAYGTMSDASANVGTFTYVLTVKAITITQTAPTSGSAPYGDPFSDQLQTSGNLGRVTFATDSSTGWGTVSSTGAVSFPRTTPPGTYFLFGTDADAFGDTGQWQYVLTAGGPPPFQTLPISGSVTVAGSAAFADHLRTTSRFEPVTFIKTGGRAGLKVSPSGKITTTGTLAVGIYTATGTMSDAYGETGTWVYTLTVKAVAITQTSPISGTVSVVRSAVLAVHLKTTGNTGPVTFTGGGAGLKVSPRGKIATTGTLAIGIYTATGTDSDAFGDTGYFAYTVLVDLPLFSQTTPTSGSVTVTGSAAFTDHLRTTGNTGPVTFIKTGGTAGLKVSSRGQITTTGTLAMGTYTATGTMSDAFGDTGIWVYTLTVKAVTITQTALTAANSEAD